MFYFDALTNLILPSSSPHPKTAALYTEHQGNIFDFQAQAQKTLDTALSTVRELFPVKGNNKTLVLKKLEVGKVLPDDDFAAIKQTMLKGGTWSWPILADMDLVDNKTGKVVDTVKGMKLMGVPRFTPAHGYMVDGSWRYVQNQLRLKPGAYSVITKDGKYETQVMGKGSHNFKINLDPKTSLFWIQASTSSSNIKLLPVLEDLGLPSEDIRQAWGDEIFRRNQQAAAGTRDNEISKFHKAMFGTTTTQAEAATRISTYLEERTTLDPRTTQRTLGRAHEKMSPLAFLDSSRKLLRMSRGEDKPDDRNSMANKELHSLDTFLREYIQKSKATIQRSLQAQIDKRDSIRSAVSPLYFNKPVNSFFGNSSLSSTIDQTNPVEMMGEQFKLTLMGEGGIQSDKAVSEEVRQVHGSQAGIIDPLHTPESSAIGTTLSVTMGATRKGNDLAQHVVNARTGKLETLTAEELDGKVLAFPGQFQKKGAGWVPTKQDITALHQGQEKIVKPGQVDYVMPTAKGMFTLSSNLIPFINNTAGARAMMGSKHVEQALPLKDPEAPLVQSQAKPGVSFEKVLGMEMATRSRRDGTVTKVTDTAIHIRDSKGNTEAHGLYQDLPLNKLTYLNSSPVVKPGDKVQQGQLLADNNYTKGGELALGKNLQVAYLPHKEGLSFEDSVVISETASRKLTSLHMYKIPVPGGDNVVLDKRKFVALYPTAFTSTQVESIGDNGVAKVGARVSKGDPIALRLVQEQATTEDRLLAQLRRGINRGMKNRSVLWTEDFEGVIASVTPQGKDYMVAIKTEEPARQGDKTSVRFGGKGIISKVLPDAEMPHTLEGKPMEVLLNPQGVLARMNVGQTLENLAGKVADKVGKPVHIDNFSPGNQAQRVLDLAHQHGVSDKEDLVDPATGKIIPQVAVGKNYLYKLNHPVRDKFSARALGPYSDDLTPTKGDHQGGVSLDKLTTYSLMAHGAKNILRESAALKSEANPEWWRAYRKGQTLPLPRERESFTRFTEKLKGAGVNVERRGGEMLLSPVLDKDVEQFSNGEIRKPAQVLAKNLAPEKYGLFDRDITGGLQGEGWGHFTLAEPMPHPTFEEPIKVLAGLNKANFEGLVKGKLFWDPKQKQFTGVEGEVSPDGEIRKPFLTGGRAIKSMLSDIDVDRDLEALKAQLPQLSGSKLDEANKKIRYLQALQKTGKHPSEYVVTKIPVVPPKLRPVYPDQQGNLRHSDLNYLYRNMMLVNSSLKDLKDLPDEHKSTQRTAVYDSMKALAGLTSEPVMSQGKTHKGILMQIGGYPQAKEGEFQKKLLKFRQDLTGKSTIVTAPDMGIDEVGVPKEMAWKIFRERGLRELSLRGKTLLKAQEIWDKRTPEAEDVLQAVMETQPVLLNRAPSLHKQSIQAFQPKLTKGQAIGLHPLVTKGYNADHDGDTMFVHVPVLPQAINEAKKMLPSQNLFNPRDNSLLVMPDQEAIQGLFLLTREGRKTGKSFPDEKAALQAYKKAEIRVDDLILVGGKSTTAGRIQINNILPPQYRDPSRVWTKAAAASVLSSLAKESPKQFPSVVNNVKDLGNSQAYFSGATLGASDLLIPTGQRDNILESAEKQVKKVHSNPRLDEEQKKERAALILQEADLKVMENQKKLLGQLPNNQVALVSQAGAKGKPDQIKQIVSAGVLYNRGQEPVPVPVKHSLAEGYTPADYWISSYGSRKGMFDKVMSTSRPGEMSKSLINSLGKYPITIKDCGTRRGSEVRLVDKNEAHSAVGHMLAEQADGLSRGIVLTHGHIQDLLNKRISIVKIRSPLVCEAEKGVCSFCYGIQQEKGHFPAIGENVGALAAHSIGEPGVQTVLKAFHTAGVSSAAKAAGVTSQFDRINQILNVPKTIPLSATLAQVDGPVRAVVRAPAGGHYVDVGGTEHFVEPGLQLGVQMGQQIQKGQQISTGTVNPHHLMELKGPEAARDHISRELFNTYTQGGTAIRKVHTDMAARAMTNFGKITNAGVNQDYVQGDFAPVSRLEGLNTQGQGIQYKPILTGVQQTPLKSTDWLSRMGATNLKKTLLEGASKYWRSNIHGADPVPALAFGSEFGQNEGGLY